MTILNATIVERDRTPSEVWPKVTWLQGSICKCSVWHSLQHDHSVSWPSLRSVRSGAAVAALRKLVIRRAQNILEMRCLVYVHVITNFALHASYHGRGLIKWQYARRYSNRSTFSVITCFFRFLWHWSVYSGYPSKFPVSWSNPEYAKRCSIWRSGGVFPGCESKWVLHYYGLEGSDFCPTARAVHKVLWRTSRHK